MDASRHPNGDSHGMAGEVNKAAPTAKAIAHTGMTVRDLEESIRFWRDVLGFEVQHRLELSGEFAEQITGVVDAHFALALLVSGGHRIELLQYLRPSVRAHIRPRPCDVGSFHVAVTVDDLDDVAAACARHGWDLVGRPQTGVQGPLARSRFAYLRNRDGSIIELVQNP
jgi:catechol 2,3-dioxygenase-like lactoylglutathione lyase family enzyme